MRSPEHDVEAKRLLLLSPLDGSQDFYVSCMLAMPTSLVRVERERLLQGYAARSRREGSR
ncbi:MAG: hypothetical protein ACLR82_02250 [Bifidobacterium longum]